MTVPSRAAHVLFLLLTAMSLAAWTPARADTLVHVERGSVWRYFRATSHPSPGDRDGWTAREFDDGAWQQGSTPIGYGDGPFGVDLDDQNPTMEDSYSTVCLRTIFSLSSPADVSALRAIVDYDDGFALWINGDEVLRVNVPANTDWDEFASGSHESGSYESFDLDDFAGALRAGENVVAVQLFNRSLGSSDAKLDLELVDPFAPDRTGPMIESVGPTAGTTVRALSTIEVRFNEDVRGVDAADLEIDGSPATSVVGSGRGPFTFSFPAVGPGEVAVSWRQAHGIEDLAAPANVFVPQGWAYTVDPDAPVARVRITEFLASNLAGLRDDDGDRSDWIELTNEGAQSVSLEGFSLTDDRERTARWVFSRVTLASGARLVVFASGKDRRPTNGSALHTSFKLNDDGEFLGLFSGDVPRELLSSIADFPPQRPDISYGVDATGTWSHLSPPTPGSTNDTSERLAGILPAPRASVARGFYSQPIVVELLASDPLATIWYTLDGREPGPGSGQRYTSALEFAGTPDQAVVTLRASLRRNGFVASRTRTWTYLFVEHVLSQPSNPAGFSRSWGSAPGVDYGMDTRVTGDLSYHDDILDTLVDLPTLSIVMDEDDLFGSSGIYSNPTSDGVAWERPASVELIYPDGKDGFDIDCGIRIHGGASRQPIHSPKHSLRLLFKGAYGATKLRFPLFEDSVVDMFDTVVLRSNFNNSWISRRVGQRARGQLHRDQWFRDKQAEMSGDSSHGGFMHVYLNGLYWGVYNPCERPSAPFAYQHYGGEREDWDALNSGVVVDGDRRAWSTMFSIARSGISSLADLDALGEYLDLAHFSDYMLLNFFGGNTDWPGHNWYAVRRRRDGDGFRFISWDAERSLEDVNQNRLGVSGSNNPAALWAALRQNAEFRLLFADRAHKHLFGTGALTIQSAFGRYNERAVNLFDAVAAESARWGDYRETVHRYLEPPYPLYTRDEQWTTEYFRLTNDYFPLRTARFVTQLRNAAFYPGVAPPGFSRAPGQVVAGTRVTLTGIAAVETVFFTTDGTDPRVRGSGDPSPTAIEYEGPFTIDSFTHLKLRARDGATWSVLAEAAFYPQPNDSPLVISEVLYSPSGDDDLEFVELVNRGQIAISLAGVSLASGVRFRFGEQDSIGPGEHIVVVADRVAFATRYPDVAIAGEFAGSLDNGGERVRLVRRVSGASETIVSVAYDDDGFWPLGPDGFGFSLVLSDPELDPDDPRAWRTSADVGGSPGRADPDVSRGGVRIHEVFANAARSADRFVELHNFTGEDIDVGRWLLGVASNGLSDLDVVELPPGSVVTAGGFLSFSAAELESRSAVFSLDSRGGRLVLLELLPGSEPSGYIVGAEYGASVEPTPFGTHDTTFSLEFVALASDTPDAANATPRSPDVVINEVHYHPGENGVEFVEFYNTTDAPIDLGGWMLRGVSDFFKDRSWRFDSGVTLEADAFLLVVPTDPEEFRALQEIGPDVRVLGPFGGALDNGGERLRLMRPLVDGSGEEEEIDAVRFDDLAPWPREPDGVGPSLERVSPSDFGNDPLNWAASEFDGGTPGERNSVTSDDESLQRPGDVNQDVVLDLTDGVSILGYLFGGIDVVLPCGDGELSHASNLALLDANGSGEVSLADAVHLFSYLFQGGPAHVLGTQCVPLPECSDACR